MPPTVACAQSLRAALALVVVRAPLTYAPMKLICRSGAKLEAKAKSKLAMFCHVPVEHVMSVFDVDSIFRVPVLLEGQGLIAIYRAHFATAIPSYSLAKWITLADRLKHGLRRKVAIAVVGKYTDLEDAYFSLIKAVKHAAYALSLEPVILWVESSALEDVHKKKDCAAYHQAWERLVSAECARCAQWRGWAALMTPAPTER